MRWDWGQAKVSSNLGSLARCQQGWAKWLRWLMNLFLSLLLFLCSFFIYLFSAVLFSGQCLNLVSVLDHNLPWLASRCDGIAASHPYLSTSRCRAAMAACLRRRAAPRRCESRGAKRVSDLRRAPDRQKLENPYLTAPIPVRIISMKSGGCVPNQGWFYIEKMCSLNNQKIRHQTRSNPTHFVWTGNNLFRDFYSWILSFIRTHLFKAWWS